MVEKQNNNEKSELNKNLPTELEFNPMEFEIGIKDHWENIEIQKIIKENHMEKPPFYFLQGPPYTSGRIHTGHAWNMSMKDFIIRYKTMNGYDVWNRAGYDMHGLPTANKVQAKLGLKTKEDIEKFGLDKFANECKKFSSEMALAMNEDFRRLGVNMDFDNAYMPIDNDYMEGIWWVIKKAHEKNLLYEGLRTTSWCAECQTALAKHEQEYKELADNSIFVKFKVSPEESKFENESLLIWTTTPWTITYNLAVMINPEFDYVRAKIVALEEGHICAKEGEVWIVAKELLESVEGHCNVKLEIIDEFKGKDIEGLSYVHPWGDQVKDYSEIKLEAPKAHTILMTTEYCTLDAGSGLVHCAPGCGPEDYEVGYQNKIPAFNNIDESGIVPEGMGKFTGLRAKVDDKKFIEFMVEYDMLAGKQSYVHDYAHCERCHNPVVFKTTKQWFFKIEHLKNKMIELNNQVKWVPKSAYNAFNSWLENLRDNSITKQRFWGTPIPLWKCEDTEGCGHYDVYGSKEELKAAGAQNIPENLHKPWIDDCTLDCPKCGKTMKRLPDVLDVWIDAGSASWNCLYYPKRTDLFERYFPADFILEGKDQIRGWFNLLMISSILGFDMESFKAVYLHGFITDVDGVKMSKSLGNVISPYEIIDKYGADTLRLYMSETNAGEDIKFAWDEAELRYRNMKILWNTHIFFINLAKDLGVKPQIVDSISNDLPEKYIISKLHQTIKNVTRDFENYRIDALPKQVQELFLELSRTYIKQVRDKSSKGTVDEKTEVVNTIYTVLIDTLKLMAPMVPFVTDRIYQNLNAELDLGFKSSIHLESWPKFNEDLISESLEKEMSLAQDLIASLLAARDKSKLGVRWPLSKFLIKVNENVEAKTELTESIANIKEMVLMQTNIKGYEFVETFDDVDYEIKPNYRKLGADFGTDTGDVLTHLKTLDQEELALKLVKEGVYKTSVNDKEIEFNKDQFDVTSNVHEPWAYSQFKLGEIFLNKEQSPELLNEGYSREVTRRVQNLRKTAGLTKNDSVELYLEFNLEGIDISKYLDSLKETVGATVLFVSGDKPPKEFEFTSTEKVKGNEFTIHMTKLE